MNLTFLNPLFLFGLAAAILPVLIHRLTKKKAITRDFSAVRLLLQSQRVMSRPQRLKHLLLLALRILAVMSLVLMVAQPLLVRQGVLALGRGGAKVLIIDNSLSMGYKEDHGPRHELAKKAANKILQDLKGQVLVITTGPTGPTAPTQGRQISEGEIRWMGTEAASKELDSIPLSYGRGDPASALALAYRKLREVEMSGEILILSDMARGDWEGFNLSNLGLVPAGIRLTFLRIGGARRDPNVAIKGARLAEGEAVVGGPARLEVAVSNLSDQPRSTLVEIYLSGIKGDQKSVELKAGEEGKISFELFLDKPGWLNGEIRLSGDRLSSDDIFYFPLKVREKVKVLVVDGAPRIAHKGSESYYLANALQPGSSEGSSFLTKVITEPELANLDPKAYEAFFLLNLARPQGSKLSSILESGRPVFIFLGDHVIPEEYHSIPLLPWRLRGVKEAGPSRPERIAWVDETSGSLKPFSEAGEESLKSASFHRYFKVDGDTKHLLTFGNKDPLLVETDVGKGKAYLFTSSADLDWNDLPLKAAFLPLIQGLVKEAVGLTRNNLPPMIRFGEPFREESRPLQAAGPQGGPGIYQFLNPLGEMRYGVNPTFEESDLSKLTEDDIRKRFGTIDVKVVEYNETSLDNLQGARRELWPFLLAFLFVVLAVEMGVANGMAKSLRDNLKE